MRVRKEEVAFLTVFVPQSRGVCNNLLLVFSTEYYFDINLFMFNSLRPEPIILHDFSIEYQAKHG
jgi:hypothetical protein